MDPDYVNGSLCTTFTVEVKINISETVQASTGIYGMFGFAYYLTWNDTLLTCTLADITTYVPSDVNPWFWSDGHFTVENKIKDNNTHSYAEVTFGSAGGFNGTMTLAEYNFRVKRAHARAGECVLDVTNKGFCDDNADAITMTVYHGYFEYTPPEHDIAVFLEAPEHLMPGDSALLNATAVNYGLNNETDVELQLLIDGDVKNSTVIDSLQVGTSYRISYLWTTPTVEANYNVTAYALPVPNEDYIVNNMESRRVLVSYVIKVPFHYSTIQEAIYAANPGDTILVSAGTYYERLVVDKSLKLVGEESSIPIIDGGGVDIIIRVRADNVEISKFTIQNGYIGIDIFYVKNCTVNGNTITNTDVGILLLETDYNMISGNKMSDNKGEGIFLDGSGNNSIIDNTITNNSCGIYLEYSSNNTISGNNIANNDYGIYLRKSNGSTFTYNTISENFIGILVELSKDNIIYHNNFVDNTFYQVYIYESTNVWDNGCEGNYWSDYAGEDLDGDGIGDTLLPHQGVDYYPLMSPYMEGDVNHDATVNIFDLVTVAVVHGAKSSDPNWNPHADLNEDKTIDIKDILIVAIHFGEKDC